MKLGSKSFVLAAALALCSCSTAKFYTQAMRGQAEIWSRQRLVAEVLADPAETEAVKKKLRLVLELREFAKKELKLPAESFGTYSDLKRPYVVWVVYAAEPFHVEPKEWWYPFVGKLSYRGFFRQEDAKAEALKLKNAGYDVFAAGVEAYSTLGYFKDPVLNTCMHRSDAELAELVFHELTHSRLFVPGDTNFNEAFATANAQAGVRRWLRSQGRLGELRAYEAHLRKEKEINRLALEARERLRKLYAEEKKPLEQKRSLLQTLQERLGHLGMKEQATDVRSGKELKLVWNNARLNTIATYFKMVPGFERILRQAGGDLEAFYGKVEALGKQSAAERQRVLEGGGGHVP